MAIIISSAHGTLYNPTLLDSITNTTSFNSSQFLTNQILFDETTNLLYVLDSRVKADNQSYLYLSVFNVNISNGDLEWKSEFSLNVFKSTNLVISFINPAPYVIAISQLYQELDFSIWYAFHVVDGEYLLHDMDYGIVFLSYVTDTSCELESAIYLYGWLPVHNLTNHIVIYPYYNGQFFYATLSLHKVFIEILLLCDSMYQNYMHSSLLLQFTHKRYTVDSRNNLCKYDSFGLNAEIGRSSEICYQLSDLVPIDGIINYSYIIMDLFLIL